VFTYTVQSEASYTLSQTGYEITDPQPCHRRTGGKLKINEEDFVQGGIAPYTYYEIRNGVRYQQLDIQLYEEMAEEGVSGRVAEEVLNEARD
jgi:hypothetical protein